MNEGRNHQIDRLIEAVLASSKYKSIGVDFIRFIGTQELTRQGNLKQAIKSTKNKLHQVGGAYQRSTPRYSSWLDELKHAKRSANKKHFLDTCKWIMGHHSSTRERLPILEQVDKTAGLRLLETINADHLVISFPAHSLGGKSKGMAANYETRFYEQVANKPWSIQRLQFPGELVFLVSKL